MNASNGNGFRMSDAFIRRWTRILIVLVIGLPLTGIGLGIASDGDWAPDWLSTAGLVVVVVGFVGPILAAAILGGESIRRGGGIVGALLTYGMVGWATGKTHDIGWLLWTGVAACVLAVIGFWVMGWKAGVPMYVGTPRFHSKTVQRPENSNSESGDHNDQ